MEKMQNIHQNQYRMFTSVRVTLTGHETDNSWTNLPALVKAVGELDTVNSGIAAQLEVTAVPNGAAIRKKNALAALVSLAHEVAAATHAYATEAGDDELAAEVDFSLSDLAKGRPASVIARCNKIAALAAENLDALADSNITQAKLTALGKKTDAFEKVASKPRLGVARRRRRTRRCPGCCSRARSSWPGAWTG